jgi:TfoX/Sxy family transcriptional regulator of competence genes
MAHDALLADRIRVILGRRRGVTEKKMFGGVCFLVNGNMACGVAVDDLMLRLGDESAAAALEEPHTRPMDFTGKPLKRMVYVAPAGIRGDDELRSWVDRGVAFARTPPPK